VKGSLQSGTIWLAVLLLAVVSALASLGRVHWLLGNLSHFRPQYAVVGLLLLPGFFVLRRRRAVFVFSLLILIAFNATFLLPYLQSGSGEAAGDRESIYVLLWNTWRKNRDFKSVNELLRREGADVVLLQETTLNVLGHLADLEKSYRILVSGDEAVLVRRSLPHRFGVVTGQPFRGFHLELVVGSGAIDLLAVHLAAPLSTRSAERRAEQLAALTTWVNGRSSPVVILGDLNATPWSHEIQDLRSQCRLEDSLVGRGLQPTWPFHNAFTSLLRIPLDHCLHSPQVVVLDRFVGDAAGSNHRPLFVRIALAD